MKKYLIHGICFMVITLFLSVNGKSFASEDIVIPQLVNALNQNNVELEKWTVYYRSELPGSHEIKNKFTSKENQDYLTNLFKELSLPQDQFLWEVSSSADKWKAVGLSKRDHYKEKITFIAYPHNKKNSTYLIYEVEGNDWSQNNWQEIKVHIQGQASKIFPEVPENYSCVKGTSGDIMEGVLYKRAAMLLKEFSAKEIEALKEETFVSISAYTDKWKQDIPTTNGKINIQVALRTTGMGGKTNVTIGTPIITAEY